MNTMNKARVGDEVRVASGATGILEGTMVSPGGRYAVRFPDGRIGRYYSVMPVAEWPRASDMPAILAALDPQVAQ